jgi:hypothetical protein
MRRARTLDHRTHGIAMLKTELGQTNLYERDNPAAALPAPLVIRQQILQFESALRFTATGAILPDCHHRERSDDSARVGIDRYAGQISEPADRAVD